MHKECDGCKYWKSLACGTYSGNNGTMGCHHLLETGERRKVEQGRCWSWTERRNAGKKPFRVKQ